MNTQEQVEMMAVATAIGDGEQNLFAVKTKLRKAELEATRIELRVYVDVCNQRNSDGKPFYSNEKLREAAIQQILSADVPYQNLQVDIENYAAEAVKASSWVDLQKRKFCILELFQSTK